MKADWLHRSIAIFAAILLLVCSLALGVSAVSAFAAEQADPSAAVQTADEAGGNVTVEVVGQPALVRFTLGQEYDPEWLIVRVTDAEGSSLRFLTRGDFTILAGSITQEGDNEIAVSIPIDGVSYYTQMTLHGVSITMAEAPVWLYYVIGGCCILTLIAVIAGCSIGAGRRARA